MVELTERDLFDLFINDYQEAKMSNLSIANFLKLMSEKYKIKEVIDEQQKSLIKKSLKNYLTCKNRNFIDQHIAVDWNLLHNLGSESVILNLQSSISSKISSISSGSKLSCTRKRPLNELESREQLKRRLKEKIEKKKVFQSC